MNYSRSGYVNYLTYTLGLGLVLGLELWLGLIVSLFVRLTLTKGCQGQSDKQTPSPCQLTSLI